MKHKPILLHKLQSKNDGKGREVIGLIGTHRGTGVTYTGLMLAFYLGEELGKKTAFVECNAHKDMEYIRKAYEWTQQENSFSFHRITCFSQVPTEGLAKLFGEDYEALILDFGVDFLASREEFLRCTTKIIIGGRTEWEQPKLAQFITDTREFLGSKRWFYLIPQADNNIIRKVTKEVGVRVLAIPRTEEPTLPTKESNKFFKELFDLV